uniref:Uncharacterized protein n=1 Tax=Caenorhabditis japonica TaxID=281687 RepID=A0A8R1IHT6_CAEJA
MDPCYDRFYEVGAQYVVYWIVNKNNSFLTVECLIVDRKLWVNAEQIRLILKEPISLMCSMENVRMSSEDCETWQEEAAQTVDVLAHELIVVHPTIQPYAFL